MAFIPIAAGHVSSKHEKTIVQLLRERGAMQRETAQPLPDLSKMQRRFLGRAVDRGLVRPVAGHRYYLDKDALSDLRSRQWAMAFSILVVAAGVAAVFALT